MAGFFPVADCSAGKGLHLVALLPGSLEASRMTWSLPFHKDGCAFVHGLFNLVKDADTSSGFSSNLRKT